MDSGNDSGNPVVEIDLSSLTERLDDQQEVLAELRDDLNEFNENFIGGVGVIMGLIGMIVGFMAAKELLKVWLH